MSVHATIIIHKDCEGVTEAGIWFQVAKEILDPRIDGVFQTQISSDNPPEELKGESKGD